MLAGTERDRPFEIWLGLVLRVGVATAGVIVALGATLYLWRDGLSTQDMHLFRGEPADLRSIHGIVSDAVAREPRGVIQLGLLVLIGTPVLRVVCSSVGFARERDWVYVTITLVVLSLLGYSLLAT